MPAKSDTAAPAAAPAPAAEPAAFDLTIEEWCRSESQTDRRVELLAAFFADERANGVVKDTAANFKARYADFATRPA